MDADLVLEGGGVKGIGLVGAITVLEEAGYTFHRVAGTSAGAIVGALVAARIPAARLEELLRTVDYRRFRDRGLLDHLGPPGEALSLLFEKGIYKGHYLEEWLTEQLAAAGVHTFGDLRIDDDPGSSLPPEHAYRLVVMTADVTHGALVRLPWDYRERYGLDPDRQSVAAAVRCSMSIPFFYEPVQVTDVRSGVRAFLVDGGVLSNFPVDAFDRTDGRPPRWPTFGVKLSARAAANQVAHPDIDSPLDLGLAIVGTMMNAHDQMHLDEPCVQRRTVFVDTGQVQATDFDIGAPQQAALYGAGRTAASDFMRTWDFDTYVRDCRGGGS